MKKISLILIVFLVIGLMPFATAPSHQVQASEDQEEDSPIPIAGGSKLGFIGSMRIKAVEPSEIESIAIAHPSVIATRKIPEEIKQKIAIEKTRLAKEKEEVKEKISESRIILRELKKSNDKEQKVTAIKDYLSNVIELMTIKLSNLEGKVYKTSSISDDEALEILSWITDQKNTLNNINKQVSSLNSQSTTQDVKNLIKNLKDSWSISKKGINKYSQKFANSKVELSLAKLNLASKQIESTISKSEPSKASTQEVTILYKKYNQDLKEAETHLTKSKELVEIKEYNQAKIEYNQAIEALQMGSKKLGKITSRFWDEKSVDLKINEAIYITEQQNQVPTARVLPPTTENPTPIQDEPKDTDGVDQQDS